MPLLNNEIDTRNIELARQSEELLRRRERELKLVPKNELLPFVMSLKDAAYPIEQIYVSHPDETFSLRVRGEWHEDGPQFSATLKDTGEVTDEGLDRMEVEVPINEETFLYYQRNTRFPRVKKLRANPEPGVTVDFIEGIALPVIEVETTNGNERSALASRLIDGSINRSDDPTLQNESIAYALHKGEAHRPTFESNEDFVRRIKSEMIARYVAGHQYVVVGISGMSGAGKTTVTKALEKELVDTFGETFRPAIVSTDDYHRGKRWLEETYGAPWTEWDDPRVYNTNALAGDLRAFFDGEPIAKRHFDFELEETVYDDTIAPRPFVIIEGLYAGSPDLNDVRTIHFELPTGIATSIGRDVRRLVIEGRANNAFPDPESRLRYAIESALPTYLSQERPARNQYSACMRPLAERAFMLEALKG